MSMVHRAIGAAVAVVVATVPSGVAGAAPCWLPPVDAPVTDPFRPPACTWCPGNRGIEFGTERGAPIVAAATGRVTFAGRVAGTVYVVVRHGDGRRVTYGNLIGESFERDDLVARGQLVGRAAGRFHLGVREGDRYVDPTPFLGRLVRPPRLIPVHGQRGNDSPPPRLTCRSRGSIRPMSSPAEMPTTAILRAGGAV